MKLIFIVTGILFISTLVLCYKEENGTIRIDLIRQKSVREQHLNAPSLDKYGINFQNFYSDLSKTNRTNDSIALRRYFDNEFYGEIVIGHPGQKMNVAFDTAWTLSWVLSSKCVIWKTIGCWFHNKYDHSKSSYWKKDNRPYSGNEGSYNLTGFFSYENISFAHSNVTGFSFVEMVQVPYMYLFNKADGILGLGLRNPNGGYEPFFYTLYRQKKIKDPIFSIYLNRDKQSTRGGNIMLGFIDDKHIHKTIYPNKTIITDTIKYVPVDPGEYWQFSVDKIVITSDQNKTHLLCPKGCKAISDSSSNEIIGPTDQVDYIHNLINAKQFLNFWTVECEKVNKFPKIDFVLGGQPFRIGGPQYIIKMSYMSVTLCVSALVPNTVPSVEGLWVLGGAFLSQYYSIYDINKKQIGFVRAA